MRKRRYGKEYADATRFFEWLRYIIISKNSAGGALVVMRFYILGCCAR